MLMLAYLWGLPIQGKECMIKIIMLNILFLPKFKGQVVVVTIIAWDKVREFNQGDTGMATYMYIHN